MSENNPFAKSPLFVLLNPNKREITVSMPDPATMNAADLELLIAQLASARQAMEPPVPINPHDPSISSHFVTTHCLFEPITEGKPAITHGARFLFRSVLFGWQTFDASPEYCRGLTKWLDGSPPVETAGKTLN